MTIFDLLNWQMIVNVDISCLLMDESRGSLVDFEAFNESQHDKQTAAISKQAVCICIRSARSVGCGFERERRR